MALLAVAAVCLSVPAAGLPGVLSGARAECRRSAEADEAVASLMACLSEVAKTLAGQTAAVIERSADGFAIPAELSTTLPPRDDTPVVAVRLHVSRLNLPPPAALS